MNVLPRYSLRAGRRSVCQKHEHACKLLLRSSCPITPLSLRSEKAHCLPGNDTLHSFASSRSALRGNDARYVLPQGTQIAPVRSPGRTLRRKQPRAGRIFLHSSGTRSKTCNFKSNQLFSIDRTRSVLRLPRIITAARLLPSPSVGTLEGDNVHSLSFVCLIVSSTRWRRGATDLCPLE